MLIVKLGKKDKIDVALKKLKRKVIKTKQMKKLRDRMHFTKKSDIRRKQLQKAKYVQRLKHKDE
tara:strand:- start:540 stop:731 length:192 start_codon:yes stop_codon:yes gene_type:complete